MPILDRIETLANEVAPVSANISLVPRGSPRYCDRGMRGMVRFATRRGSLLPTLMPDVEAALVDPVQQGTRVLKMARLASGYVVDGIVAVNDIERHLLGDIVTDTGELVLYDTLLADHAAGSRVTTYAVPMNVVGGTWAAGVTTLQVRSDTGIYNGDRLVVQSTPGNVLSSTELPIRQARYLSPSGARFNYEIDLDPTTPLPRVLTVDEVVYLKALPAYSSGVLPVPTSVPNGADLLGPFLVDHLSGRFFTGDDITDTLSIQLYQSGLPLSGYDYPVTVTKNHPITRIPIQNDSMLFWRRAAGEIGYSEHRVRCTCVDGRFRLFTPIVPSWQVPAAAPGAVGVEWDVRVLSASSATIRVAAHPNGYRDFFIYAGIPATLRVGAAAGSQPIECLDVIVSSETPDAMVEFSSWWPVGGHVTDISYNIVSTAVGSNRWQTSSLMAKPYFASLAELRLRYDYSGWNSGHVLL